MYVWTVYDCPPTTTGSVTVPVAAGTPCQGTMIVPLHRFEVQTSSVMFVNSAGASTHWASAASWPRPCRSFTHPPWPGVADTARTASSACAATRTAT
jgi:hypothetical protein